ncbi:methyltransferase family protein, partial [Sphingomonas bacterium]|uniref:methyltransferase family protein n=1 Tax=Sphingomonas bacterium TaxID=1895847 RepID=UPI001575FD17
GTAALVEAAAVAALMAGTVALFVWATRAMGRNWSIAARTRADHSLVTTGPFARIRHPIYSALFLLMLALAIATGHVRLLPVAVPLFAIGTFLRIGEEERMLRELFGASYVAWAARVPRFVPGLF